MHYGSMCGYYGGRKLPVQVLPCTQNRHHIFGGCVKQVGNL